MENGTAESSIEAARKVTNDGAAILLEEAMNTICRAIAVIDSAGGPTQAVAFILEDTLEEIQGVVDNIRELDDHE